MLFDMDLAFLCVWTKLSQFFLSTVTAEQFQSTDCSNTMEEISCTLKFYAPLGLVITFNCWMIKSNSRHVSIHTTIVSGSTATATTTTIISGGYYYPPLMMKHHQHKTHRYARGNLLLPLRCLLLPVGPAVLWRLLVRSPAALCLAVPRPLLDDVEQVKRALVLPVRALGLTSAVAVLAGGVVAPELLYASAQSLHYGVVQLWNRGASGGGHHRSVDDPTGHSSQTDTQHGYKCPCSRLSGGRLSHARRSLTSL